MFLTSKSKQQQQEQQATRLLVSICSVSCWLAYYQKAVAIFGNGILLQNIAKNVWPRQQEETICIHITTRTVQTSHHFEVVLKPLRYYHSYVNLFSFFFLFLSQQEDKTAGSIDTDCQHRTDLTMTMQQSSQHNNNTTSPVQPSSWCSKRLLMPLWALVHPRAFGFMKRLFKQKDSLPINWWLDHWNTSGKASSLLERGR